MSRELRYWDSNTFLAYFQEEAGRVDSCEAVLSEAEKGTVLIVTCALTLAEVLALRGAERILPTPEMKLKVIGFFKNEYVAVVNVSREVAELARDLVWDKGVKPKDAVHVACALSVETPIFETFDKPLIRKSLKLGGKPPMVVREPPLPQAPGLPLHGGGNK